MSGQGHTTVWPKHPQAKNLKLTQRSLAQFSSLGIEKVMVKATRKTMDFKEKSPEEVIELVSKASGPVLLLMKEHFESVEPDDENQVNSILGHVNSRMLSLMFQSMISISDKQEKLEKQMKRSLKKQGRSDSCETLLGASNAYAAGNDTEADDELEDDEVKGEKPITDDDAGASNSTPRSTKHSKVNGAFSAEALAAASRALTKYKPDMHFPSWCNAVERHGKLYKWTEKELVKFTIGLLSIEANAYLREKDIEDVLLSGWSSARKLLERRFFKSTHSGFARQEAENFKQTGDMSVDDYFNGMLELLQRCNSKLNEVEASGLLLRNMRPGLAKSIRRLHPCEEWTVGDLRSHALRHQAEYESRQLEDKNKVRNTSSREFTNTNRGRGGFQRRQSQRGGYFRRAFDQRSPNENTGAGESSPPAISDGSNANNFQGIRGGQRFQRPFNNYRRNNNNNYRGNFRGGFNKYRGNARGGFRPNLEGQAAYEQYPKAQEQVGAWSVGHVFDHKAYYEYLKDLRPLE